jgi:hypothetical protein
VASTVGFEHAEGFVESLDLRIDDIQLLRQIRQPSEFGFNALFPVEQLGVRFLEESERGLPPSPEEMTPVLHRGGPGAERAAPPAAQLPGRRSFGRPQDGWGSSATSDIASGVQYGCERQGLASERMSAGRTGNDIRVGAFATRILPDGKAA